MTFHIITIFPKIFDSYFSEGILRRARDRKQIDVIVHNLRDYTEDRHKTVDDTPYGGGPGMILKIEPIYKCLEAVKSKIGSKSPAQMKKARILLFSAKGKSYSQTSARRLVKYENIIMICGRYEGIDERVTRHLADEEISVGDYVLTGGEIPAMVVADSIARLLPGVLGNDASAAHESFYKNGYLEYPQYTKPAEFKKWKVPKVLLSGNHSEIGKWREKHGKYKK